MLSVDQDTGTLRLMQYNPSTDPKFVEVMVDAIDNLGVDPFMMSSVLVKVCTYRKIFFGVISHSLHTLTQYRFTLLKMMI